MLKTNSTTKPKICSTTDCAIPHHARGYCRSCYSRLVYNGEIKTARIICDDNARFDSKVHLIPFSTCHYFVGSLSRDGYGRLKINRKRVCAHRFAYDRANGKIPDGMFVLHSCHTPCCVNPDHLRVGTSGDNMRDKVLAGRQARGEKHGTAKLTAQDVLAIMADSRPYTHIAAECGVSPSAISKIKNRKTWRHI